MTHSRRDYRLFMAANFFMGFGACVDAALTNNYWKDVFRLGVAQRTALEAPRELPGFLVFLLIGVLHSLGDIRIAAVANILAAVGMTALGWIPPSYGVMLGFIFVYSAGQHVFMPLGNSIGMAFAEDGEEGKSLGKFSAANTVALVAGSLVLMAAFALLGIGGAGFPPLAYRIVYSGGGLCFLASGVCLLLMTPRRPRPAARRFVFRREYGLFYALSVLYGARKQLFITFGPWVLVEVFGQGPSTMTVLFLLISVLGIFLKPAIGRLTDGLGVRFVLGAEALLLVAVCASYAILPGVLPAGIALVAVSACYVIDQSASSVSMARAVYLKRIALSPEDVSPTLSLGISIDHVVSMFLPFLGGLAWRAGGSGGYRWVFAGGALIAAINFACTRFIPRRAEGAPLR